MPFPSAYKSGSFSPLLQPRSDPRSALPTGQVVGHIAFATDRNGVPFLQGSLTVWEYFAADDKMEKPHGSIL